MSILVRVVLGTVISLATTIAATDAQEVIRYTPELLTRITNAYPDYHPNGGKVAYMSNADGDFDVYVLDLSDWSRTQLTDAPERDGTPVWSPDGTRIAFQSFRDGHSQIYVMDADGSNQRNLSDNEYADEHPYWSADGQRIIFCSERPDPNAPDSLNVDVYSMAADGSDVQRITHSPAVETYASWSPDGSKIVCRRIISDNDWDVVILDAEGNDLNTLADSPSYDGWPVWSPDGQQIAFASLRTGVSRIYIANADGTNVRMIANDTATDDRQPTWAPSGEHVAFARYTWFESKHGYETSEIQVVRVRSN